MVLFHERLWAAPWLYIATALVIPASILVFAPINMTVGVVVAIVLYAGCVWMLLAGSPVIEVTDRELRAGRARIERRYLGQSTGFDDSEATLQRGQKLDARAWLLIRGWVKPVVRIEIVDPQDPAPYWLLSTRRPDELTRVLNDRAGTDAAAERRSGSDD
jgi:Protein of unknown function (DUF3093).